LRFLLLATVASASILRNGEEDNSGHNPLDIHNNPDLAWMLNNESSRNGEQDNGGHNPLDIHNNPDLAWMMNNDDQESSRALNDCGCAEVKSAGRIVGGAEVTAHSLPYQVYVQAGGYMCGGTILNKRYVLTLCTVFLTRMVRSMTQAQSVSLWENITSVMDSMRVARKLELRSTLNVLTTTHKP